MEGGGEPRVACVTQSEMRHELQRFAQELLEPLFSQHAARLREDVRVELRHALGEGPAKQGPWPGGDIHGPGGPVQAAPAVAVAAVGATHPEAIASSEAKEPAVEGGGEVAREPWATAGHSGNSATDFDKESLSLARYSGSSATEFNMESTLNDEGVYATSPSKDRSRAALAAWNWKLAGEEASTPKPMEREETTTNSASCRYSLKAIVRSVWFERVVSIAIIINAIVAGATAQHRSAAGMEKEERAWVTEIIFLIVFATEMILRLLVDRCDVFRMKTRQGTRNELFYWNILDLSVIGLQVVELIVEAANAQNNFVRSFGILRVLRCLRLVRIVRIVKVVRYVAALRMIVFSVGRSFSVFFWAIFSIFLLNYMCSILLTEVLLTAKSMNLVVDEEKLDDRFGTMFKTMLTLFHAVTGGRDWGDMTDVLGDMTNVLLGTVLVLIFILYVAFNQIALLNVISGIFLETALEIAKDERQGYVMHNARLVFTAADHNSNGTITWPDFKHSLDHPDMHDFFEAVDIRISEAKVLFDLLDTSGDGFISANEFLSGCLRVRGPSKALDLLILSREISQLLAKQDAILRRTQKAIAMNQRAISSNRHTIGNNVEMLSRWQPVSTMARATKLTERPQVASPEGTVLRAEEAAAPSEAGSCGGAHLPGIPEAAPS